MLSKDLLVEYKYNDSGYRTEKKITKNSQVTTTNYFLYGDKVLKETRSDGVSIDYFYDVDGKATGFSYNNNVYLYLYNLQGDITKIVDEAGSVVVEYSYDAWGNIIDQTDNELANINPYRYRGYRYDEETTLYYLNSRYYNPEIGRFINADGLVGPVGGILTHNMYAYAINNPVMMIDPSGYFLKKWLKDKINNVLDTVENALNSLEDFTSNLKGTRTIGINGSVAFGIAVGISIQQTSDLNGNIALQWSWYGGGGFPSASITGFSNVMYNTDSYKNLKGYGAQIGGSGAIFGVGAGLEGSMSFGDNQKLYYGDTFSAGIIGTPTILELHGEFGRTYTITHINVYEESHNVIDVLRIISNTLLD